MVALGIAAANRRRCAFTEAGMAPAYGPEINSCVGLMRRRPKSAGEREDRRARGRPVGMKRRLLWTLILAAVLVALVGAAAQAVRGTKPLLLA